MTQELLRLTRNNNINELCEIQQKDNSFIINGEERLKEFIAIDNIEKDNIEDLKREATIKRSEEHTSELQSL